MRARGTGERVDWDGRGLRALRHLLGAAAFGLSYSHTVEWLGAHLIDGGAGYITPACVDVLAFICLRELTRAGRAAVRLGYGLGFLATLALSLVAQVEEGSNGRGAGPLLSTVPVLAFGFLTIMHEVQRRAPAPPGGSAGGGHQSGHVAAPRVRLDVAHAAPLVSAGGRLVSASVSALPPLVTAAPVTEPEPARACMSWVDPVARTVAEKRPEKKRARAPKNGEERRLELVGGRGKFVLSSADRKALDSGDSTQADIAKKRGVSVRTVRRALDPPAGRAAVAH